MDLTVLHKISYGMYIIGVNDGGKPTGCVINTFSQVTSENPVVSVCLSKNNYTYDVLMRTGKFSVSILSEETNRNAIAAFGFASGKDIDKFSLVKHEMQNELPLVLENCCGWLTCEVISTVDAESHALVLARLTGTKTGEARKAMTYEYYHNVIKGKAPKNAPTYQGN